MAIHCCASLSYLFFFTFRFRSTPLNVFSRTASASIEYFPNDSTRIRLLNYIYVQVAFSSFLFSMKGERVFNYYYVLFKKSSAAFIVENRPLHVTT